MHAIYLWELNLMVRDGVERIGLHCSVHVDSGRVCLPRRTWLVPYAVCGAV
jgi:hypothetical protein